MVSECPEVDNVHEHGELRSGLRKVSQLSDCSGSFLILANREVKLGSLAMGVRKWLVK